MKVRSKHIDSENLKKYGQAVTEPRGEPTAQAADFKFWSDIARYFIDDETEVGICTVFKQPADEISGLERHVRTPEILIPIDAPFVVPLLLDGCSEDQVEAFQINVGEAIIIDRAVWHGASLPVGKETSSYFVIFRRGTPHNDVEIKKIEPIELVI